MKHAYPPFQRFMQGVLESGTYPGATVISELDANSYEDLPLVSWMYMNSGQLDYGLWDGVLALSLLCDAATHEAFLAHVYEQVRSWETPGLGVDQDLKLGVERVTDMAVFQLNNIAALNGKSVLQFNAQFALKIRDWS